MSKNKLFRQISSNSLNSFNGCLFLLFHFAVRNPLGVLLGVALTLGLLGSRIHQIPTLYDIDDLIDKDFKTYNSLTLLKQGFKNQNVFQYTISSNVGFSEAELCQFRKSHVNLAAFSGYVYKTLSAFELRSPLAGENSLSYPRILKLNCDEPSSQIFDLTPLKNSPWKNTLTDKELSSLTFQYQFRNTKIESWERPFDPSVAGAMFDQIQKDAKEINSLWNIYPGGNGLFQWYMFEGYKKIEALNVVVLLGIVFLFWVFFGTFKSSFLFIFTLVITLIMTRTLMYWLNYPVDVLSSALFMILTLATIEDFIYLSTWQTKYKNWKRPFQKILLPSFFTSLTTVIGFGSLAFTNLEIIRRFGIITAFGAFAEWISIFIILPAVLSKFSYFRSWTKNKASKSFFFLAKLRIRLPRWALIAFPLCLMGISSLNLDDSPTDFFHSMHPLTQSKKYLLDTRGWYLPVSLIFKDYDNETFNKSVLQQLKANSSIGEIEDPYEVEQYIRDNVPSADLATLVDREYKSSKFIDQYVSDTFGRAILYLNNDKVSMISAFTLDVEKICQKKCWLAGSLVSYAEFGQRIPNSLLTSLGICLILVLLTLGLLSYARNLPPFYIILSSLWGPAVLIAFLWVTQIQIYFVTTIFASVLVGLAGDNAVQFIFSSPQRSLEKGLKKLETPALLVTLCMVIIPLSFLLAPFLPLRELGVIFSVGTLASYIGDVGLLKSLLKSSDQ